MPDRGPDLSGGPDVSGELTFSVEGTSGSTSGTVDGVGDVLRVHIEDPHVALASGGGSVSLSRLADRVAALGLTVDGRGPSGRLVLVGARVDSGPARLLTGSRHAALGRGALRHAVVVVRSQPALGRRLATVAALGAGTVGIVVALRARRRP